jgi:hypothetical protein
LETSAYILHGCPRLGIGSQSYLSSIEYHTYIFLITSSNTKPKQAT